MPALSRTIGQQQQEGTAAAGLPAPSATDADTLTFERMVNTFETVGTPRQSSRDSMYFPGGVTAPLVGSWNDTWPNAVQSFFTGQSNWFGSLECVDVGSLVRVANLIEA